MLPILAFRLQEISNGGLTEQTQMRLREVIDSLFLSMEKLRLVNSELERGSCVSGRVKSTKF
jgi:hypothetical protein